MLKPDSNPTESDQNTMPPINSKEQALAYFTTCKAVTSDSLTDPKNITQYLLQISTINNIHKAVKNGIHTTAYLIEDMNNTNTADTITNVLKDQINDITRQLTTKPTLSTT